MMQQQIERMFHGMVSVGGYRILSKSVIPANCNARRVQSSTQDLKWNLERLNGLSSQIPLDLLALKQ